MKKIIGQLKLGQMLGTARVTGIGTQQRRDHNGRRVKYELECECGEITHRTKESLNKAIARGTGIYCLTCAQKYKFCLHDENGVRIPGQDNRYVRIKKRPEEKPKASNSYTIDSLKGLHDWGYAPR